MAELLGFSYGRYPLACFFSVTHLGEHVFLFSRSLHSDMRVRRPASFHSMVGVCSVAQRHWTYSNDDAIYEEEEFNIDHRRQSRSSFRWGDMAT